MELTGRDERKASEALVLARDELEALVTYHRSEVKRFIDCGHHEGVKRKLERIDQLHAVMPRQDFCDF